MICVERGAVDIGIIGTDMLMENRTKVLDLMDLNMKQLYMKVATSFPNVIMYYLLKNDRDVLKMMVL